MLARRYFEIDVFGAQPLRGNPLAVVADAQGLDTAQMQRFASWTNLSETTFLLPPSDPGADYHVRIFTPARELAFAGHPTLGSCQAWLAAGGQPRQPGRIVQQCGLGLVVLRSDAQGLAFAAPPMQPAPVEEPDLVAVLAALGLTRARLQRAAWLDNGPRWLGLLLDSAQAVLDLAPDMAALRSRGLVGVIGPTGADQRAALGDYEVRAFAPGDGIPEDPVTGSLNAALGQWLIGAGLAPPAYRVRQGTRLARDGRVQVQQDGAACWIGGATAICVEGQVRL
jgi:PhzF family phenazine biosynthesis protein